MQVPPTPPVVPPVWYKDPTIAGLVGALGGALLGAAATIWVWRKSIKVKRLECVRDDPLALLAPSANFQGRLNLQYNGKAVSAAYLFPFEIINTGNLAVQSQPVLVEFAERAEIVDVKVETEPKLGFGEVKVAGHGSRSLRLDIALMNPGDSVRIEVLTIENADDGAEIGMKNADVEARVVSRATFQETLMRAATDTLGVAILSSVPVVGSVVRTYATLDLSRRLDRAARRRT